MDANGMLDVPGVNIQYPISRMILDGRKTVETRTYPLPTDYLGRPIALIETPGKLGDFPARVVALIWFSESFKYLSKEDFYFDIDRHGIMPESPWAWDKKQKWGWVIQKVQVLNSEFTVHQSRGIVFTKSLVVPNQS